MGKAEKFGLVGLTGAVVAGGLYLTNQIPECYGEGGIRACSNDALNGALDYKPEPSKVELDGLEVVSRKETNTFQFTTYGGVEMGIAGHATVDYDTENVFNAWPGVDATWFYNRPVNGNEPGETKVTYNPAVQDSTDYTNDDKSTLTWEIETDTSGTPVSVNVNPLKIVPAFVRYDATEVNPFLWSPHPSNHMEVDGSVQATMRADLAKVFIAFAEYNACPLDTVDVEAVQLNTAEKVLGDIAVNASHLAAAANQLYAKGVALDFAAGSGFEIPIAPASVQVADGKKSYESTLAEVKSRSRSFPLVGQDGTVKMKPMEIGDVKIANCKQTQEVDIKVEG